MLEHSWLDAIEQFTLHQKLAGRPATTRRARREHLMHLARRVDGGPWSLDGAALREYAAAQDWATETRRARRNTFLAFWRWAVAEGHVDEVVAEALPHVKATTGRARPAPDTVYKRALLAAPPRETLMLRLAAEVGLRRAEVAHGHTDDLVEDLVGWSLVVHGKGGRERVVPLPPSLARQLSDMPRGWFFPGDDHGHLSPAYVGKLIARLLPDGWTMHTLRHRFGTRAYALQSDLLLVQELLGHSNPATTRRYIELDRSRARGLVEALESQDVRYSS